MSKAGAVIVTYNNADMLNSLLSELINQSFKLNEIIVIDNASNDSTKNMMEGMSRPVRYIRLESNLGSAGGYYEGIKAASENNDLIWLLDDDVSIRADALEALLSAWESLRTGNNIGAVRSAAGQFSFHEHPFKTKGFAWRGTLIPTEVVADIGFPRPDYFLYADDVEYSLRMSKRGYSIFWVPLSVVAERRSTDKIKLNYGGIKGIIYEEPFRLYYAHRNQVNVYLQYKDYGNLALVFAHALKVIFLFGACRVDKSKRRIKAVIDGIRDGIKGSLGRNIDYLP